MQNICKGIVPEIYARYDLPEDAIMFTLMQTEQYRKLGEYILMREERGQKPFFDSIVNLLNLMDD